METKKIRSLNLPFTLGMFPFRGSCQYIDIQWSDYSDAGLCMCKGGLMGGVVAVEWAWRCYVRVCVC